MSIGGRITLRLHGLDLHGRSVRADVFANKLRALITGLRASDTSVNGQARFEFFIRDLQASSALATVGESLSLGRPRTRTARLPARSSVAFFSAAVAIVYNGEGRADDVPPRVLKSIAALSKGVNESFSHAEIVSEENDVAVRIDDYYERQVIELVEHFALPAPEDRGFRGTAFASFDGVLKAVDLRGTIHRAKLILTAGGRELDCVVNALTVPDLGDNLDQRVFVEGVAHYDGEQQLPARLDVRTIRGAKSEPDLARWRGTFAITDEELADDW